MKSQWEIEGAEASGPAEPKFKVGDWVRRRGEAEVGQVTLVHEDKSYGVLYQDNLQSDPVHLRIMTEGSLLLADQPTRFSRG